MTRPIRATIHTQSLQHNLSVVRRYAPQSKIWSIVKANAYGHGIERVYPALQSTDGFGLLDFEEAIKLRQLGWQKPILLLEGFFNAEDIATLQHYQLTPVIHCETQLALLEKTALSQSLNQQISVYLKMNSGMNRLGFPPDVFHNAYQRLQKIAHVRAVSIMTHFANADQPNGIAHAFKMFVHNTKTIKAPRSLANSAGVLWHSATHFDWVRPGILLYGASPTGCFNDIREIDLHAAMSLESELIAIHTLKKGDTIGYGSLYTAEKPMRIGVVACGYADGYPRYIKDVKNPIPVMVCGQRTTVVGHISMDMITVDLTPCPEATIGSPVELWGKHLVIDEVAQAAQTIGYELMCAVAPRVRTCVN